MTKGDPPAAKTPQQKKALSLRKDRRNTYGQNDKAARKAIPLRKALENRRNRHKQNRAIAKLEELDEAAADVVESSATKDVYRSGGWVKSPDEPLGDYIALKQGRLKIRVGGKLRRRKQ